ncbi:hypothetical protein RFI_13017 [Reticulomyxa filosa]|uniref:Uncharacterized protein n=1 Tax=Reticulomyxa filosa TaxID=46433 RepID=X6NE26_RETFI|nr:hypothetical protein RFI_13017 [Reticulomyxa filosa]|eukprot:ETO24143.1 hypothetical protein RFI_13017 [Reticulomyxa filosa]
MHQLSLELIGEIKPQYAAVCAAQTHRGVNDKEVEILRQTINNKNNKKRKSHLLHAFIMVDLGAFANFFEIMLTLSLSIPNLIEMKKDNKIASPSLKKSMLMSMVVIVRILLSNGHIYKDKPFSDKLVERLCSVSRLTLQFWFSNHRECKLPSVSADICVLFARHLLLNRNWSQEDRISLLQSVPYLHGREWSEILDVTFQKMMNEPTNEDVHFVSKIMSNVHFPLCYHTNQNQSAATRTTHIYKYMHVNVMCLFACLLVLISKKHENSEQKPLESLRARFCAVFGDVNWLFTLNCQIDVYFISCGVDLLLDLLDMRSPLRFSATHAAQVQPIAFNGIYIPKNRVGQNLTILYYTN